MNIHKSTPRLRIYRIYGKKILENPQNYEVVDYEHEQNGNYRNLELSVREKDFYDVEANDVEQDKLLQNKSNNIANYKNEEDSLPKI